MREWHLVPNESGDLLSHIWFGGLAAQFWKCRSASLWALWASSSLLQDLPGQTGCARPLGPSCTLQWLAQNTVDTAANWITMREKFHSVYLPPVSTGFACPLAEKLLLISHKGGTCHTATWPTPKNIFSSSASWSALKSTLPRLQVLLLSITHRKMSSVPVRAWSPLGWAPLAYEIPAWRQPRLSKCPLGPQAVISRISNSALFATNRHCASWYLPS